MNRQSEALNKEYFQALGSTRASVRMLSLAWAGLFVLSIDLTHVYFFIKEQFTVDLFSNVPFLFLCLLYCSCWAVRLCHSARHSSININSLVLRCSLY